MFITFTCYRRLPLLRSVRARNAFVHVLGEVRDRYGFSTVGYVVMPEHIHLLISEPAKGTPSTVIQVLKQRVSRRLRRKRRAPPGQRLRHPRFHLNDWPLRKAVAPICCFYVTLAKISPSPILTVCHYVGRARTLSSGKVT